MTACWWNYELSGGRPGLVGATGPAVGPLQALRHSRYFETATGQSPCGHGVLQIQPLLIFSPSLDNKNGRTPAKTLWCVQWDASNNKWLNNTKRRAARHWHWLNMAEMDADSVRKPKIRHLSDSGRGPGRCVDGCYISPQLRDSTSTSSVYLCESFDLMIKGGNRLFFPTLMSCDTSSHYPYPSSKASYLSSSSSHNDRMNWNILKSLTIHFSLFVHHRHIHYTDSHFHFTTTGTLILTNTSNYVLAVGTSNE